MIKIQNLSYGYKRKNKILKEINIEIKEGEFVSIIGKNGSGKSTLAKLIAGILIPQEGKIEADGINTADKKQGLEFRKKIGIVFQNPENQIIFNKVKDDIEFALKNLNQENREEKIKEGLEKTGMLSYIEKSTFELSLGQKQRVTIAGILSLNPPYLIFDEPTTMLDSTGKKEIHTILRNLKKEGYTIIYITNALEEILLSDRIILLKEGTIVKEFGKQEIIENIPILKQENIEIPFIIKLLQILKQKQMPLKLTDWSEEEILEQIEESYSK